MNKDEAEVFAKALSARVSRRLKELGRGFPTYDERGRQLLQWAVKDSLFGCFEVKVGSPGEMSVDSRRNRVAPPIFLERTVGLLEDPDDVARAMGHYHTCETCNHRKQLFSTDGNGERTPDDIHLCAVMDLRTLPKAYKVYGIKKANSGYWYVAHADFRDDEPIQDCPAWEAKA